MTIIPKKIKAILLGGLLALTMQSPAFAGTVLDRTIAVVNNDVIMQSQLTQRLNQIYAQYPKDQLPPKEILTKQILNQLVQETLELEVAKRAGVTISNQELQQSIENIAKKNKLTPEQFEKKIALDGDTRMAREQIRREMLLSRVQQGAVNARIKISPQEVKNFLNSDEGKLQTASSYNVAHIIITLPGNATEAQIETAGDKAEKVYKDALAGKDFSELARANSGAGDALKGGQLGWKKIQDLPTLYANKVAKMEVGQVTKPFRSGAGFHILKLQNMQGADAQVVKQTEVRHILIKPNAIRTDEQSQKLLEELRKRIEAGEDFSAIAKEYSEDYGSGAQGGDLGWSMPGTFVPAFEKTMNNTKVGEISEPFRSQFGWHILEVTGRRDQDMSDKYREMMAQNFLKSRKFQDELPRWRQELKDEAYISFKPPYDKLK